MQRQLLRMITTQNLELTYYNLSLRNWGCRTKLIRVMKTQNLKLTFYNKWIQIILNCEIRPSLRMQSQTDQDEENFENCNLSKSSKSIRKVARFKVYHICIYAKTTISIFMVCQQFVKTILWIMKSNTFLEKNLV